MGRLAKLVDTEQKIDQFKKRYDFLEDVQIRYASSDNLALLEYRDLVLPIIIAIVEGGVRIPMHPFFIQFLTHFRLSPLQCVPNVFRVVMGTTILIDKLGLNQTVHDIMYVYRLQLTGKKQYTLVARHWERKLVIGLLDSSKGRDEDFLVITGNWQNPVLSCPLIPGVPSLCRFIELPSFFFFPKCLLLSSSFSDSFLDFTAKDVAFVERKTVEQIRIFTAKDVAFVERKTVEHLLRRPCFIDTAGRPRSAPILLDYVPTYKSFQKGPVVKFRRQIEVTMSRPGKDQEDIIQAVPLTKNRGVQIPHLVIPLSDPHFVPSTQPSEVGFPVIRFPSLFDPSPQLDDDMPVQRRSIDIGSVLGTLVPQSSETSSLPPPPRFSQGEDVMRKRKRGREEEKRMMKLGSNKNCPRPSPSKPNPHKKRGKRDDRSVEDDDLVIKGNEARARGGQVADTVGRLFSFLPRDMRIWQGDSSERLIKTLKRDSVVKVCSRPNLTGLEYKISSQLWVEVGELKDAVNVAREGAQKAEEKAQAYYDQGFDKAAASLKLTLPRATPPRETKFDQVVDKMANNWPFSSRASIPYFTAYLGGNVCAKILSDPLQLGLRAKTLRQEVHFSYHTQLSDRQELLRSSRNLSQKMTPWHKEHSDGLCSQDHILRTQARLCARPVPLKSRRNKAVLKFPEFSHRRCRACAQSLPDSQQVDLRARAHWKEDTSMHDVELSDRQEFIGVSRNPDRKTALKRTKNTPVDSARGAISHEVQARIPANPEPCKNRQRKLSDGTKNVKIRHRELGQICARTGTRFEKKRAGSKTHFFSRTAAFARRVFPARNKLIREPGCVGKIMTPATTWNSRFADSIPRLTGICIGRVHKNSSDTPTSGSHNSLVRTPIRANFISLERGRRELSDDMPHDPF
uniref:Transposase (putative) gypsy type domain-containing protein n=1 Tax=Fagus sylvatica TaxID=28930 RepID=A0A2N9GJI7_FAGSY